MNPKSTECLNMEALYQLLHVVSLVCLNLPLGLGWYFGNLVVYLDSYWYCELNATHFLSSWGISTFSVTFCLGEAMAGLIIKKTGKPVFILFIGVLLINLAFYLGIFAVQYSQALFIGIYGPLTGLAAGFIQAENLTRVSTLVMKRSEIPIIAMFNSFNVGGIIFDWVMTWYANPDNAVADHPVMSGAPISVITDPSVIRRVPYIFFVLGTICSAVTLLGFSLTVLLGNKGTTSQNNHEKSPGGRGEKEIAAVPDTSAPECVNKVDGSNERLKPCVEGNSSVKSRTGEAVSRREKTPCENTKLCHSSLEKGNGGNCVEDKTSEKEIDDLWDGEAKVFGIGDFTPIEMLKTFTFYMAAINLVINDVSFLVLFNFYKVFGQIWIHDDHFMTQLGMFSIAIAIVLRSTLAVFIGKYGVKTTQIIVNTATSLTFVFYWFAPQINRWLFALMTCLMGGLCSSVYALCPVMTLKLFGDSHLATNTGILLSPTVLLNLAAPPLMQFMMEKLGWCALFQITGGLNAIALLLSITVLPNSV